MFPKVKKLKNPIYLDYAATTPLDPRVKKVMEPFLGAKFGNPSSLYQKGREAKDAVEQSRKTIAGLIGARPPEIIFTAGGTESVNLAIFGTARNYRNPAKSQYHLIASAIEHHCVLNSLKALNNEDFKTTLVGVSADGFIDLDKLKKSIRPETILISVMLANNEIGTVQPVAEIGKWLKKINTERDLDRLTPILLHTDACQAAGFLDLDVNRLGVDLMSVNGSKIYGPKQVGFLYVRSGVKIKPLIYGGGQEKDLRGGTENVAGVVGLAKAFELSVKDQNEENLRLLELRNYLTSQIKQSAKGLLLNGVDESGLKTHNNKNISFKKLPNNVNFCFNGVEGESLMLYLDAYGFCVSTASACSTNNASEPSHVLLALGRTKTQAQSAIRFTLGKQTTKSDLDKLLKILPDLVKELRKVNK